MRIDAIFNSGMLLTAKEAAEKLGISLRQMQTLLKNERLPARKFGNNWMIEEKDLEAVRERPITGRPKKNAGEK